jgi:hypothetical protein
MFKAKYYFLRKYVKAKWYIKSVKNSLNHDIEIKDNLPIQQKSTKLWKLLLKDSDSVISCSMVNKIRQIEKDNLLIILSPINELDCQMTIMDVDEFKSCLYEIRFGQKSAFTLIDLFDVENERRMLIGQTEKRDSIHNDLDKLLKQQEGTLRKQKRNQPTG